MISGLTPSSEQFLANLERIQERAARAQQQLSSGLRVSQASADPDQLGGILDTVKELGRVEQISLNLSRVKGEVDTAESGLQEAVKIMDRVRTIAAQGVTSTQTAEQRRVLMVEVEGLMERLVSVANISHEGRSIFSGDADDQTAYSVDWNQPNGVSPYGGWPATRKVEHPAGYLFSVSRTASDIFDAPGGESVFAAVTALRNSLRDNDQAGISAAVDLVRTSQTRLGAELGFYGSVQRQVADAAGFAAGQTVRLKTTLSRLRDADLTAAILELKDAGVQQEAALGAHAKIPRTTLFDYLG